VTQALPTTPTKMPSHTGLPLPNAKGNGLWPSVLTKEQEAELERDNRLAEILAEMKGQVLAELANQRHDLRELNAKMDSFQTRREAEKMQHDNDRRINSLELDRRWAVQQIFSLWFAGVMAAGAAIVALLRKMV